MSHVNFLATQIATLSRKPEFGSDEYKKWIEQDDLIQFLRNMTRLREIVLYASTPVTFLYGVLVPTRAVTPPDISDLDGWDCNPFSGWGVTMTSGRQARAYLSHPLDSGRSETITRGEQVVFARSFEGRQEQRSYIEISQKIAQTFDLHYVPERNAYCRFDRHGDIEDVVRIVELSADNREDDGQVISIDRDVLDEYMAITKQSLVMLFDSTRLDHGNFNGWSNATVDRQEASPEIWYRMGRNGSSASYARGFQIFRSLLANKDVVKLRSSSRSSDKKYVEFVTQDWRNDSIRECSCDPSRLGNYFVESHLPFEISPVFFRPEVLSKYKGDPDKYRIRERSIECRNAWYLERYDVNDAGPVFTYIKYLGYLPYEEQLYWRSFNEAPKAPVSQRAFMADFEGRWDAPYDSLQSLKGRLRELDALGSSWWKLGSQALIEQVHYPITGSATEWGRELHALDKLLIEGFAVAQLRSQVKLLGREYDNSWKSIRLLQEVMAGTGKSEDEVKEVVGPLKELNMLRNKVSGHHSGSVSEIKTRILKEHKSYLAHFRSLCAKCDAAICALRDIL